jgi:hypothetical protein
LKTIVDPSVTEAKQLLGASLGQEYQVLSLHPGIALRAKNFIKFALARRQSNPNETVSTVLEAYREKLGTIKLYRALLLKPSEVDAIRSQGLIANSQRNGSNEVEDIVNFAKKGVFAAIKDHLRSSGAKVSPFASFTEEQDLARWVTKLSSVTDKKRYIFSVRRNVLDAVYTDFDSHSGILTEGIFWGNVPKESITNLADMEGEVGEDVDYLDVIDSFRFRGSSQPSIPWENRPAPLPMQELRK